MTRKITKVEKPQQDTKDNIQKQNNGNGEAMTQY